MILNKEFEYIFPLFKNRVGNDSGSSSEPAQQYSFDISLPFPLLNATIETFINRVEAQNNWTNYPEEGMTMDGVYEGWKCKAGLNTRTDKIDNIFKSKLHGRVGYSYLYSHGNWYESQQLEIKVTIRGKIFIN